MNKYDTGAAVEEWGKQVLRAALGLSRFQICKSTEVEPAEANRIILSAKVDEWVKEGPGYFPVALGITLRMNRRSKAEFESKSGAIENVFKAPPAVPAINSFRLLEIVSAGGGEKQTSRNARDGGFTVNLFAAKL